MSTSEGFHENVVKFNPGSPEVKQNDNDAESVKQFADFTKEEMTNLNARIISQLPWAPEGIEHPVFKDMPPALVNALKAASQRERNIPGERPIVIALEERFDKILDEEDKAA